MNEAASFNGFPIVPRAEMKCLQISRGTSIPERERRFNQRKPLSTLD
jgi:hypothetical protein